MVELLNQLQNLMKQLGELRQCRLPAEERESAELSVLLALAAGLAAAAKQVEHEAKSLLAEAEARDVSAPIACRMRIAG